MQKRRINKSVELNTAWRDISEENEVIENGTDTETIEDGTTSVQHSDG